MTEKENTIGIDFGAMCKPIKEQLEKQGYTISDNDNGLLEKLNHSLIFLHLHGIIPDSTYYKCNLNLLKKIVKAAVVCEGEDCNFCGGSGKKQWKHRESKNHSSGSVTTCPKCKGSGKVRANIEGG